MVFPVNTASNGMSWTKNSEKLLAHLSSDTQSRDRIHVEEWAKRKGLREISASALFNSKPPIEDLYECDMQKEYDPLAGPVLSVELSPFDKHTFLVASTDGAVLLYQLSQVRCYI